MNGRKSSERKKIIYKMKKLYKSKEKGKMRNLISSVMYTERGWKEEKKNKTKNSNESENGTKQKNSNVSENGMKWN